MSCDEKTMKELEAGLKFPVVSEEEVEKMYNHSSLKWEYGKPYSKLSEDTKKVLRKVTRNMKKAKVSK